MEEEMEWPPMQHPPMRRPRVEPRTVVVVLP
ncbi:MAG: hypothetical protein ACI8QS_003695 [Planctomycetota bacterium]|jgi:hypothetical protein